MKKVLVTGASGFLGRHLVSKIKNLGWECYISNTKIGNLLNEENLHIYNTHKLDYIFHLAAHTKAGDYCLYHKGEQFEINQLINTNILKYWRAHQPQAKMIAMGTSCSYSPDIELIEDNYLSGEPEKGLYTYAMTKRMLLVGLKAYAEQYGLKYNYYIPSTLYGPQFDFNDSHFIFDLIKKIYNGKYNSDSVVLWGDGYQKRELVYIDDFIQILIDTLDFTNQVINIGSGHNYTIREFASNVSSILEYNDSLIKYDITKYVGVKEKKLDISKLNSLVTIKSTSLSEGLLNTINYYKNNKTI